MLEVLGDVLDKPVFDRNGRPLGRADGITVSIAPGEPPRLEAILIGPVAAAERVSTRAARWTAAILHRFSLRAEPLVVPFASVEITRLDLRADVAAADTGLLDLEQRLQRWLARIPGSR